MCCARSNRIADTRSVNHRQGAPETIEETDAEAPDPERRAASRRAARLAACEEGFEREKARTADFLKSLRAYENRLQAERRRDALQRAR